MTYDDIENLLRKAEDKAMTTNAKEAGRSLSESWETIQKAHDHTTAATQVRDAGMEREFYLIALADLADVRDSAEAEVRRIARHLVDTHNVATSTVAQQAGVAQSTVSRWATRED